MQLFKLISILCSAYTCNDHCGLKEEYVGFIHFTDAVMQFLVHGH